MSKKVLILSSSPRRNGNSDLLCNEFMRGAAEAGHQVEKIFLKDKHIKLLHGMQRMQHVRQTLPTKGRCRRSGGKDDCRRRHRHGNPRLLLHHERADEDTD